MSKRRSKTVATKRNAAGTSEDETAQRILEAAQRVLATKGWKELSVASICGEAGVYRAAINYHFGNKAGLMTALVDAVMRQNAQMIVRQVTGLPLGEQRVRETVGALAMLGGADAQLAFFEVFVHLLRSEEGRHRLRRFYQDMLGMAAVALMGGEAGLQRHPGIGERISLAFAFADGLVIQQLIGGLADYDAVIDLFTEQFTLLLNHERRQDDMAHDVD